MRSLAADIGYEMKAKMFTDSSAATAMIRRQGFLKVRHFETKYLWRQQIVKDSRLFVLKVKGECGCPDQILERLGDGEGAWQSWHADYPHGQMRDLSGGAGRMHIASLSRACCGQCMDHMIIRSYDHMDI